SVFSEPQPRLLDASVHMFSKWDLKPISQWLAILIRPCMLRATSLGERLSFLPPKPSASAHCQFNYSNLLRRCSRHSSAGVFAILLHSPRCRKLRLASGLARKACACKSLRKDELSAR